MNKFLISNQEYFTKKELSEIFGCTQRNINIRFNLFANEQSNAAVELKKKDGNKVLYHKEFAKSLYSPKELEAVESNEENLAKIAALEQELFSLRQGGKELRGKQNSGQRNNLKEVLSNHLGKFPWSYFCGLNFEGHASKDKCRRIMEDFFRKLEKENPKKTIRLYFTIEENPAIDKSYHLHFVLYISIDIKPLNTMLKSLCKNCIIFIEDFDASQEGINYVNKTFIHKGGIADWDILGNKLKEEANKYVQTT